MVAISVFQILELRPVRILAHCCLLIPAKLPKQTIEDLMSTVKHKQKPASSTKPVDASRVQSAAARSSGGSIATGSYVGRMQAAAARNHANPDTSKDTNKQKNLDNHSNQLNPNSDAYWQSRGLTERPANWAEKTDAKAASSVPLPVK